VTPDERGQILSQRDPTVYRRYYLPDFIDRDCQAIYLGTVPQDQLIRRVGRLPFHLDAPQALTDAQKSEIRNDPDLLRLYRRRDKVAKKIKKKYSPMRAAEGTRRYERHQRLQRRINCLQQKLRTERFDKAQADFWKTIYTEIVDKQLQGVLPSTEPLTLSTMEYELEERDTIAKLFLECRDDLKEHQLFQLRMDIMRNLIILCRRQESRKPRKKMQQSLSQDESSKATNDEVSNDEVKVDLSVPDEQLLLRSTFYCPFCRCDEEAGPLKRNKHFARIDGLRRHVRVQHLEYKRPNEGFICPYQGCMTPLKGTMHFLNHTALEHGLCL
jgi:hypothetical protein